MMILLEQFLLTLRESGLTTTPEIDSFLDSLLQEEWQQTGTEEEVSDLPDDESSETASPLPDDRAESSR